MHRQTLIASTPMHDLIRLIEKIDTVIKDYLRQRFCVAASTIKEKTLEDIIARLRLNPYHFKELNEAIAAPTETSTYTTVKNALVSGVKLVDKTLRYYANTDGTFRLDTLAWLCWSMRNFNSYLTRVESMNAKTDAVVLISSLAKDTKEFLDAVSRILNDTTPDDKSSFNLSRARKKFLIYGLKGDPSELARLLRVHLLDEFDCKNLVALLQADIELKASLLVQDLNDRVQEKKQVQELEESNADLLRQLEASHNSVQQLKFELLGSRDRAAAIESELRIKRFQENTFERRIGKLEREKQILEKKQSQLDKNSASVDHLQSEIEAMRQALAVAEDERNEMLNEKRLLLSSVSKEQSRQDEIQQQLSDAHQANNSLNDQLDNIAEIADDYSNFDNEDEEVLQITLALKEYASTHPAVEPQASTPAPVNVVRVFPGFDDELEGGLACAQIHALKGQAGYLKALLKRDNALVNKICDATVKSPHSLKSPLEIVLFDSRAPLKDRIETLGVILLFRPDINSHDRKVFSDITLRLDNEKIPDELSSIFCEYVVAKKTCSAEALAILKNEMAIVDDCVDKLLADDANIALQKLSLPLTVCRALRYGYINGSFSKATPFLDGEKLADHALYEILYDDGRRQEAEKKYQRKFGAPLLRTTLIRMLEDIFHELQSARRGFSVIAKRENADLILSESEVAIMQKKVKPRSTPTKLISPSLPPLSAEAVKLYCELVTHLIMIIDRYGVILNSKGFNTYQRAEISAQILSQDTDADLKLEENVQPALRFN